MLCSHFLAPGFMVICVGAGANTFASLSDHWRRHQQPQLQLSTEEKQLSVKPLQNFAVQLLLEHKLVSVNGPG